jgi:hypothetical protein
MSKSSASEQRAEWPLASEGLECDDNACRRHTGIVLVSGPYDLRTAGDFVNDFVEGEHGGASPLLRNRAGAVVTLGPREAVFVDESQRLVEALRTKAGRQRSSFLKATMEQPWPSASETVLSSGRSRG